MKKKEYVFTNLYEQISIYLFVSLALFGIFDHDLTLYGHSGKR